MSDEGESDGHAESIIVGLPFDGTRLGGYGCTGVSGGVCLQSSPQWSGKCKSNGVMVPPHPSSKLQGSAASTIGGVLAVLLDVSVGVGGQK